MTTTSGIYCITHTATGRRYVGSAVNVSRRWTAHKSLLSRGRHHNPILQNGWNAHGAEAFTFSAVESVADVNDLIAREQHWIDTVDPFYNIRLRAESSLGLKPSAETRAKMSAWQKGRKFTPEHRAKLSAAQTGHKHTAAARAKISAGGMGNTRNLGRKPTAETRAKISAALMGRKQSPAHVAAAVASRAAFFAKKGESA